MNDDLKSMKTPSRRMTPRAGQTPGWGTWLFLTSVMIALAIWAYNQPPVLAFVAALVIFTVVSSSIHSKRMGKLAEDRGTESICTFARTFDRKKADTWVLRAVYEGISDFISISDKATPVRATDRWREDLCIDPDDLDELVIEAAYRAGRSMEEAEKNPLYGKVQTVSDIVEFLTRQPRIAASSAKPRLN